MRSSRSRRIVSVDDHVDGRTVPDVVARLLEAIGLDPDEAMDQRVEVELHVPALLPEDYLPDVHTRLVMYKRIASAGDEPELAILHD